MISPICATSFTATTCIVAKQQSRRRQHRTTCCLARTKMRWPQWRGWQGRLIGVSRAVKGRRQEAGRRRANLLSPLLCELALVAVHLSGAELAQGLRRLFFLVHDQLQARRLLRELREGCERKGGGEDAASGVTGERRGQGVETRPDHCLRSRRTHVGQAGDVRSALLLRTRHKLVAIREDREAAHDVKAEARTRERHDGSAHVTQVADGLGPHLQAGMDAEVWRSGTMVTAPAPAARCIRPAAWPSQVDNPHKQK